MAESSLVPIEVRLDTRAAERTLDRFAKKASRIKVNLALDDRKFTQPLGRITGSVTEFHKSLEASHARVLAFTASAGILYGVTRAFTEMGRAAIEVEKSLKDINVILQASERNLKKFGDQLFDVASKTGQSFFEVSKAAGEFARQGLSMEKTITRTRDALVLMRLSGMDAEASVNSLTAAINSFSSAALNSTQIVNRLANVDAAFAVSSNDLAEAIRRVASTAQGANVQFNELIAVVTSAQQVTARGGNVIGNSLKTIFTRIQRTEVINQLNDLGVAVRNVNGEMRPAMKVLGDLAKRYDTLAGAEKAYTAELVGGVYQMNILKAILKDLGSEYSIYGQALKVANDTTDEAMQRNKELNKTLSALINESTQNLTKFGAEMGKVTFEPVIKKVLNAFNSMQKKTDFFGDVGKFLGFDEGKAADFGGKMAKGIFESIGNFLSGPGLILLGTVVFKLLGDFGKFVSKATADFVGMNRSAQEQAAIQKQINQYIAQNPQLLDAVRKGEISVLNVEKQVLDTIKMQVREKAALDNITRGMASRMSASGVGAKIDKGAGTYNMTASRGFVPNFNRQKEINGALAGGYKPGNVRSFYQPGEGNITYNDAEQRKRFKGMKQTAIMPPRKSRAGEEYDESFKGVWGFSPYKNASGGFVPNMMGVYTSMGLATSGPISNMKNNKTMKIAGSTLIKGSPKGLQDVLSYALRPGENVTFSFAGGNQVMTADERRRIPTRASGESLGKYNVRKGAAQEAIFAGRRGYSRAFAGGKAGVQHPNLPVDLRGPRGAVEVKSPEFVRSGKPVDPARGGRLTSKDLISLFGKTLYENNSSSARQIRSRLSAAGPQGAHLLEKFNNYLGGHASRRAGEIRAYTGRGSSLSAVNQQMGFDTRHTGGTRSGGFVPNLKGLTMGMSGKQAQAAAMMEGGQSAVATAHQVGVGVGTLHRWAYGPLGSPRFKKAYQKAKNSESNKHGRAGEAFENGLLKYFGLPGTAKQARFDFVGASAIPPAPSKRRKINMSPATVEGDAHKGGGHGPASFGGKLLEHLKMTESQLMGYYDPAFGGIKMPTSKFADIVRTGRDRVAPGKTTWGQIRAKSKRYTEGKFTGIGDSMKVQMPYMIDQVSWPPKGKARGFVPNFYSQKDKQNALFTEQLMGAKKPEFREYPFPHVADAATQPTFKDVLQDHPEGLKKAIKNSGKMQARLGGGQGYKGKVGASGFIPNFQGGGTTGMDMGVIAASMGMAAMGAQQMKQSFDELRATTKELEQAEKNTADAAKAAGDAHDEGLRANTAASQKHADQKRIFESSKHSGDAAYYKNMKAFNAAGGTGAMSAADVDAGLASRGMGGMAGKTISEKRQALQRKLDEEVRIVTERTKAARVDMNAAKAQMNEQKALTKAKGDERRAAEEAARHAKQAAADNKKQNKGMRGAANFIGKNAFGAQMMLTTGAGIARGMVSEDNQTAQGAIQGAETFAQFTAMGAMFGPWGAAAGAAAGAMAGLGQAMDKMSDPMPALEKSLAGVTEKLNRAKGAGMDYLKALEAQGKVLDGAEVTGDDLEKSQKAVSDAFKELPADLRSRFAGVVGDSEKIKKIFGEMTQEMAKRQKEMQAVVANQKVIESGKGGWWTKQWRKRVSDSRDDFFADDAGGQAQMEMMAGSVFRSMDTEKMKGAAGQQRLEDLQNAMSNMTQEGRGTGGVDDLVEAMKNFGASEKQLKQVKEIASRNADEGRAMAEEMMKGVVDIRKHWKNAPARERAAKAARDATEAHAKSLRDIATLRKRLNNAMSVHMQIMKKAVETEMKLAHNRQKFIRDMGVMRLSGARDVAKPFLGERESIDWETQIKGRQLQNTQLTQISSAIQKSMKDGFKEANKLLDSTGKSLVARSEKAATERTTESRKERDAQKQGQLQKELMPILQNYMEEMRKNSTSSEVNRKKLVADLTGAIQRSTGNEGPAAGTAALVIASKLHEIQGDLGNRLAQILQETNMQRIQQEEQAKYQKLALEVQERLEKLGGAKEFVAEAGNYGWSKNFDKQTKLLEQIYSTTGTARTGGMGAGNVDRGRNSAMLLEGLINDLKLRGTGKDKGNMLGSGAFGPLGGRAVAGRALDIKEQIAMYRKMTELELGGALGKETGTEDLEKSFKAAEDDAGKTAADQIAAQFKFQDMPQEVERLRVQADLLNEIMSSHTDQYFKNNEEAFMNALQKSGLNAKNLADIENKGIAATVKSTEVSIGAQDRFTGELITAGSTNSSMIANKNWAGFKALYQLLGKGEQLEVLTALENKWKAQTDTMRARGASLKEGRSGESVDDFVLDKNFFGHTGNLRFQSGVGTLSALGSGVGNTGGFDSIVDYMAQNRKAGERGHELAAAMPGVQGGLLGTGRGGWNVNPQHDRGQASGGRGWHVEVSDAQFADMTAEQRAKATVEFQAKLQAEKSLQAFANLSKIQDHIRTGQRSGRISRTGQSYDVDKPFDQFDDDGALLNKHTKGARGFIGGLGKIGSYRLPKPGETPLMFNQTSGGTDADADRMGFASALAGREFDMPIAGKARLHHKWGGAFSDTNRAKMQMMVQQQMGFNLQSKKIVDQMFGKGAFEQLRTGKTGAGTVFKADAMGGGFSTATGRTLTGSQMQQLQMAAGNVKQFTRSGLLTGDKRFSGETGSYLMNLAQESGHGTREDLALDQISGLKGVGFRHDKAESHILKNWLDTTAQGNKTLFILLQESQKQWAKENIATGKAENILKDNTTRLSHKAKRDQKYYNDNIKLLQAVTWSAHYKNLAKKGQMHGTAGMSQTHKNIALTGFDALSTQGQKKALQSLDPDLQKQFLAGLSKDDAAKYAHLLRNPMEAQDLTQWQAAERHVAKMKPGETPSAYMQRINPASALGGLMIGDEYSATAPDLKSRDASRQKYVNDLKKLVNKSEMALSPEQARLLEGRGLDIKDGNLSFLQDGRLTSQPYNTVTSALTNRLGGIGQQQSALDKIIAYKEANRTKHTWGTAASLTFGGQAGKDRQAKIDAEQKQIDEWKKQKKELEKESIGLSGSLKALAKFGEMTERMRKQNDNAKALAQQQAALLELDEDEKGNAEKRKKILDDIIVLKQEAADRQWKLARNQLDMQLADPTKFANEKAAAVRNTTNLAIRSGNYDFFEDTMAEIKESWHYGTMEMDRDVNKLFTNMAGTFRTGVKNAFKDAITGTKDLKEAFGGLFQALSDQVLDTIMEMATNRLLSGLMSGIGQGRKFARGGEVTGGTGTRDDVPARLMAGEFVIRKSAVNKYGRDFFANLNKGATEQHSLGGVAGLAAIGGLAAYGARRKPTEAEKKAEERQRKMLDKHRGLMDDARARGLTPGTTQTDRQFNVAKGIRTTGSSAKVNLANAFLYNDPMFASAFAGKTHGQLGKGMFSISKSEGSKFDIDRRLSNKALTDPDNPRNQIRIEKEKALWDFEKSEASRYQSHRKSIDKWREQKKDRMKAAYIAAGTSLATGWLSGEGSGFSGDFSGGKGGNVGGKLWKGGKKGWKNFKSGKWWESRPTWMGGKGRIKPGYGKKMGFRNPDDLHGLMSDNGFMKGSGSYNYKAYAQDHGGLNWKKLRGWARRARGGYTQDDIPALLTGGEYVINRDAVSRYGRQFFEDINSGRSTGVQGYNKGGFVTKRGPAGSPANSAALGNQNNNVNVTVNIDQAGGISSTISGGGMGEKEGRNFGELIKNQVMKVIVEQRRQGGVLSPAMLRNDVRTSG